MRNRGYTAGPEEYASARPTAKSAGKGVLLQRTKTVKAGDFLECEIFPVVAMEPGIRERRQKKSPEAIRRINERNAIKRLERLMNANFGPGDLLPHLTMAAACTEEEMMGVVRAFIRRLRRLAKKRGSALRYIYVLESTGAGDSLKWHVHMVCNGDFASRDEVEKMWRHGLARVDRCQRMEKGLCGFARYITMRKETQARLLRRRWACSKGLKQPTITSSDSKFSRAACAKIAREAEGDARALFEKKYPGYRLIEQPMIRYSDWLPGVYIYAMMERIE